MMKTSPAVFVTDGEYRIMVPVDRPSLFSVRVGGKDYFDEFCGVMRSDVDIHAVTVPQGELDAAGGYTVVERDIIDRKPYFPLTEEPRETAFAFTPVPENPRAYLVADAHNRIETPVAAARAYGEIDFLIFGGDIPNHSGEAAYFDTIYRIADELTHGTKPIVFARGNHDLRGKLAERMGDFIPTFRGNTYHKFRLGGIAGVILDCGEDKDDSHPEYGHTVCCASFRARQTEFLRSLEIPDADCRVVVVHNPFTATKKPPFDIEAETFGEWAKLLGSNFAPDLMISGHTHKMAILEPGDDQDWLGHPCPVVIGSDVVKETGFFTGAGFAFGKDAVTVTFTSEDGSVLPPRRVELKR